MPVMQFDTLDVVPEALRAHAVEKDGKYHLDVVPAMKLEEFRQNNTTLLGERDNLKNVIARLQTEAGVAPDKLDDWLSQFKELKTIKQQVDDGKLVKDSSLEDALAQRTTEMQRKFQEDQQRLEAALSEKDKVILQKTRELNNSFLSQVVTEACNEKTSGVRRDAVRAVVKEAQDFFQVEDGKLVAKEGDKVIYSADGVTPMTPLEWIKTRLVKISPYLFENSQGGGSQGGGVGGTGFTQEQLAKMDPQTKMQLGRQRRK